MIRIQNHRILGLKVAYMQAKLPTAPKRKVPESTL